MTSSVAPKRPRAHQDRDLLSRVQHVGGLLQHSVVRQLCRARIADAGMGRAVNQRRVFIVQQLQVVGQDHASDDALRGGDANGTINKLADLSGHAGHVDVVSRHVLEEVLEVDFLLVVGSKGGTGLLADNGHDRHVVGLGVIQSRQQMDRAGARSRIAKPDLAGELGVGGGHEGRHLLVAHLNVLHLAFGFF